MDHIIIILIAIVVIYILYKQKDRKNIDEMHAMIEKIKKRDPTFNIRAELKDSYEETIKNIKSQEAQLTNSIKELKEYRDELDVTYDSLLKKTEQLEYSNDKLEKKVLDLSNINTVAKTVLSSLELEKIIDVIIDAYFALTGIKKIAIYLWNNGELELKQAKSDFVNNNISDISFSKKEFSKYSRSQFITIYNQLSKTIEISENECIVISELIVKEKELGVIYIIEDKSQLNYSNETTISALSIQVAIAINNALIYSELLVKERLDNELQVAANIQKKLLPQALKNINGIEIAQYFNPAKEIGGDYYDYSLSGESKLWITIGDVSGKGIPAAFLMALIRSILKTLEYKDSYPMEVLTDLNDIIYPDISEDMFVTIFHSQYDFLTKTLYFSNAGHTPLIFYKASTGEVSEQNIKGIAIGFVEFYEYKMDKIKLEKGDIILYYTDGLNEAENRKKEFFGINKLKKIIKETHNLKAEEIKALLLENLDKFLDGKEQIDDITFVILKIER